MNFCVRADILAKDVRNSVESSTTTARFAVHREQIHCYWPLDVGTNKKKPEISAQNSFKSGNWSLSFWVAVMDTMGNKTGLNAWNLFDEKQSCSGHYLEHGWSRFPYPAFDYVTSCRELKLMSPAGRSINLSLFTLPIAWLTPNTNDQRFPQPDKQNNNNGRIYGPDVVDVGGKHTPLSDWDVRGTKITEGEWQKQMFHFGLPLLTHWSWQNATLLISVSGTAPFFFFFKKIFQQKSVCVCSSFVWLILREDLSPNVLCRCAGARACVCVPALSLFRQQKFVGPKWTDGVPPLSGSRSHCSGGTTDNEYSRRTHQLLCQTALCGACCWRISPPVNGTLAANSPA